MGEIMIVEILVLLKRISDSRESRRVPTSSKQQLVRVVAFLLLALLLKYLTFPFIAFTITLCTFGIVPFADSTAFLNDGFNVALKIFLICTVFYFVIMWIVSAWNDG